MIKEKGEDRAKLRTEQKEKKAIRADDDKVIDKPKKDEKGALRNKYRQYRHDMIMKFNSAYDSRKRYDWEWLTRDLYRRGYQFSRYNPTNRTVVLSSRSTIKVPVNLVWAQMRAIKNQVTSFQPKWEVMPSGINEDAVTNARYSSRLLDYYFGKLNLKKMIKETVIQGLLYSIGGPWQIGYDPEADNGNGEVYIWLLDPYDFYIDPSAPSLEEAEFCIKAVRKPLDEIKTNPRYKFYEKPEHGEFKQAASEYKQFLLQALKYQSSYTETEEGVILKEAWAKIRVNDDNKEEIMEELNRSDEDTKELRKGEVVMRVVTFLDILEDPLEVQLVRRSDYPFEIYQADINPLEIYGESWVKHVIPINRVLNALESSVFQYNYKYALGRIVIDKNSGVRIITNEHGSIVEKNQGSEVTSLPLQPLPQSYELQIKNMRSYIEDIGGAHDISFGRVPAGIKSGVGIAELKQADATNQSDFVDNMEDFLVRVGKKLLKEIANNFDIPKIIKVLGKNGDPEHFAAIGEKGVSQRKNKKQVKIGTDIFDIAVIGQDNEVTVKIGSWLSYTKEAQEEKLRELFQAGLIDQQTFLENTEFPNIKEIVDRTRKEELLKKFRGSPAQGQQQVGDEEIAEQENIIMVQEGREAPVEETDVHAVHIAIHQEFADDPIVSKHLYVHESMLQTSPKQATPQQLGQQLPMMPGMPSQAMPMGQAPMGQPPMGQQPIGTPEEQALMQSLQDITGGQGGPIR